MKPEGQHTLKVDCPVGLRTVPPNKHAFEHIVESGVTAVTEDTFRGHLNNDRLA